VKVAVPPTPSLAGTLAISTKLLVVPTLRSIRNPASSGLLSSQDSSTEVDVRAAAVRVVGGKIVQYDRRKGEIVDEAAVTTKFGVGPGSIADYLALVGDTADGYPGIPGWGAKSAATVLAKFGSIPDIPTSSGEWGLGGLRGAEKLAVTLRDNLELALLFRRIATVETDVEVGTVDDWQWKGPTEGFAAIAARLGAPHLAERAKRLAERTAPAG